MKKTNTKKKETISFFLVALVNFGIGGLLFSWGARQGGDIGSFFGGLAILVSFFHLAWGVVTLLLSIGAEQPEKHGPRLLISIAATLAPWLLLLLVLLRLSLQKFS